MAEGHFRPPEPPSRTAQRRVVRRHAARRCPTHIPRARNVAQPPPARAWERGVDELAEEDEDVADYVRSLEETRDTTELPEASGEAIAREFERYLKRRNGDG